MNFDTRPRNAPFFRPAGAPTNQPRATPWESSPFTWQALKGRHNATHSTAPFRPFRAETVRTQSPGAALPLVALPLADLWLPLRGGKRSDSSDDA